jgi:hypothetical protein
VFATVIHFNPILMFVVKAESLPSVWSTIRAPLRYAPSLHCSFQNRVEVTNTLSYYDTAKIKAVKRRLLVLLLTVGQNKLQCLSVAGFFSLV